MNRRVFLKSSFLATTISIVFNKKIYASTIYDNLLILQEDLFPNIERFNISIKGINAKEYLAYILHHKKISQNEKKFIKDGFKILNRYSIKLQKDLYYKLPKDKRDKVLKYISKTKWGKDFIETILTYILEALLGDPIYGINTNEVGWKWLNHQPGVPRPIKAYNG